MSEQKARFNPGDNIPAFAQTAVVGGRFVSVVGAKTAQGDYPIEHAAANEGHPFGVAEYDSGPTTQDAFSIERRVNVIRPGAIARVQAGAEVKPKDLIKVGAEGKALPGAESAIAVGRALTLATTGSIAEIELF